MVSLEATIAKERSYANTISYLTPPAENVGLYKGLMQLSELTSSYQSLKDTGRGQQTVSAIISTSRQCILDKDVDLSDEGAEISSNEQLEISKRGIKFDDGIIGTCLQQSSVYMMAIVMF